MAGSSSPIAARELADGTRMVVNADSRAFSVVRYDATGAQLSVATFYPSFNETITPGFDNYPGPALVAIDPFGALFVGAVSGLCCSNFYLDGNVWIMKFDGLTGRALWAAPATWAAPSRRIAAPAQLLIDGGGNLVVSVFSLERNQIGTTDQTTFKYDGETGALLWGPISLLATQASLALDGSGNVFLSARNSSGAGGDLEAVRYAAATGATQWGPVPFDSGGTGNPGVAAVDADGDFVVAGPFVGFVSEHGFQAIKFDGQSGAVKWGPARWTAPAGSQGGPSALVTAATGDVLVSGFLNVSPTRVETVDFSGATGQLRWAAAAATNFGSPVLLAPGNGDAILSYAQFSGGSNSVLTVRYRGVDGGVVWGPTSLPGLSFNGGAPVSALAANGNVLLAVSGLNGTVYGASTEELEAASGSAAWGPTFFAGVGAGRAQLNELTVAPDGNPIVTGWVSQPSGTVNWATLKYDATTGAVLWGPSLFDAQVFGYQSPWQVTTDGAGDAFVAGYTGLQDQPFTIVKYSGTTGQQLWVSGLAASFTPYGLAVNAAGDALVVGQVTGPTSLDTALVKFSGATGQIVWGPVLFDSGVDDYPFTLTLDAAGNGILIGGSYDPMTGIEHWFTWKASGVDGHALWGPDPDSGQYGTAEHAAVDGAGDVIVTGLSDSQMRTVKYSGATGAILWGPMVVTGPEADAGGLWIAVDGNGDAIATGTSYSKFNGVYDADFVTVKYRGSDGAALWGPVFFDSASHGNDYVYAVVLDAAGNPVVSGPSETTSPGLFRIASLKYDGATGSVMWGPVLTAPAGNTYLDGLASSGSRVYLGAVTADAYDIAVLDESLGIATMPDDVAPETCGVAGGLQLIAKNGAPSYSWSLTSGALPSGLALGVDGSVSGVPTQEGSFPFGVQVQDSLGATASRSFVLDVVPGAWVPILAAAGPSCQVTLSVPGPWTSYQWLPTGEATPTIQVTPLETTTYEVLLSDGSGCVSRGAITLPASALVDPGCRAPSVASISPASGDAAGGTLVAVTGTNFQPGASLTIGGASAGGVAVGSASSLTATTPALAPGTVNDVVLSNPDTGEAVLPAAWTTDFLDVPPSDPFHAYVLSVLRNGVTAGCGNGNYCPQDAVTRAQMAVFLVRAKFGASYQPPPASGTVFADVPANGFAAAFIEQLAALGVTTGCGGGNYCPNSLVTRAQMAVFLLKTSLGEAYVPPAATGTVFGDVHVGDFAAAWIEDLFHRAITGGCSASPPLYCPGASSTRAQMAVFLVKTFDLP